jgi:hypothetical protein
MRSGTSKALAVAVALLLLTAACGGKSNKTKTTNASSSTTSTTAAEATTTAPAAGAATTAKPGAKAATTVASRPGTTSKPTQASGAPAPATPGTYDYAQSGTSSLGAVSPNGTLKVDAANGSGVQVFHRYPDPSGPANDTTIAFRSDGPFITDTVVRQGGQEIKCHFEPGIPAPPWPATDGKPIKGHANCGTITVDVNGSITGHKTTMLDGKSIEVVVGKVTIKTTGAVESTSEQEQWWAPSIRLPVHTHEVTNGKLGAFAFSSDVTSDLKSGTPH